MGYLASGAGKMKVSNLMKNLKRGNLLKNLKRYLFYREPDKWKKEYRLYILLLIIAVIEFLFCFISDDLWWIRILIVCNLYALYSASWDLLGGVCGQVSLGHALFFGGAGYISALLNFHYGLPILIGILISCVVLTAFAFFLGLPLSRLKGPYFVLVTMVIPLIIISIITLFPLQLGGEGGISGFNLLAGGDIKAAFYIVLVVTLISVVIILFIAKSNLGLIIQTIREDERGAKSMGINTAKYKAITFSLSALFAALAGALYTLFMGTIGPTFLLPINSVYPIIMTIIGGIGTTLGPLIGAYIIMILDQYLQTVPALRIVIYSVVTILILRFAPSGLMGLVSRFRKGRTA